MPREGHNRWELGVVLLADGSVAIESGVLHRGFSYSGAAPIDD